MRRDVGGAAVRHAHRLQPEAEQRLGGPAAVGFARIVGVTRAAPPPPPSPGPSGHSPAQGLAVRGVRHRHAADGPEILHGITLALAPGRSPAVVGATGSGKSTPATLTAGLRRPYEGSVTFAGTPTGDLARPDGTGGRRPIALVPQEFHLFADNLRLAHRDATPPQIMSALAAVGAGEWAAALPDGVNTVVRTPARVSWWTVSWRRWCPAVGAVRRDVVRFS